MFSQPPFIAFPLDITVNTGIPQGCDEKDYFIFVEKDYLPLLIKLCQNIAASSEAIRVLRYAEGCVVALGEIQASPQRLDKVKTLLILIFWSL